MVGASAVVNACQELTALQRFAGLITFGNVLLVAGIVGVVGFLAWILVLIRIPATLYEICGYALSISLVLFARQIPLGIDPVFTVFAGCVGLGAMFLVTALLHDITDSAAGFCASLALVWGIVGIAYQSELIGFIAVGALFGALGFFVRSYPFMTVIGFEDEDSLNRATGAAFILLIFFVGYKMLGAKSPNLEIFAYGTYLIGSLVWFTGLLILAYEGYGKGNYIGRQLPIIIAGIVALFFGSVYGIPEIQKIGGTFFGLYLLEKICDVPTHGTVGYAIKGLVISAISLTAGYIVLQNKDFFAAYIIMM